MHDVYAYGVIAPSTLIELQDDHPVAGGYAEIAGVHPSLGGEAAGSAYVLARLGVPTKLQGNRLADDEPAARVIELLSAAGVDCRDIGRDSSVRPITEVVIAGGTERTVLGTYRGLLSDRDWDEPSREDIRSARVVCVDPFFDEQSQLVCAWALEAGTPYVTVDTTPDSAMVQHAEALIISEEFASRHFEMSDPPSVLDVYTAHCQGLVILTRGSHTLWYARGASPPERWEPPEVSVRDTTGAGDSFRAGIIYGMLQGHADDQLIRTAGAISALVCQRAPGVLRSPTARELHAFMSSTQ